MPTVIKILLDAVEHFVSKPLLLLCLDNRGTGFQLPDSQVQPVPLAQHVPERLLADLLRDLVSLGRTCFIQK